MKKLNYSPMIMAIVMIISLTFTSCITEIKESIKNEKRQNENLTAEQKKAEIIRVIDGVLVIYKPAQTITFDSKFNTSGKQELIKEVYNKPGKLIKLNESSEISYSPQSFWTRYKYHKETTAMYYNQSQQHFFFQQNTKTEEAWDFIPIIIFLTMIGVLIRSKYTISKIGILLPDWLCILVFCLALNWILKLGETGVIFAVIESLFFAFIAFVIYSLSFKILKLFGWKKIPMPASQPEKAYLVTAYGITAALVFSIFAKLPLLMFFPAIIVFLSPYLITWVIMGAIKIKLIKLTPQKT